MGFFDRFRKNKGNDDENFESFEQTENQNADETSGEGENTNSEGQNTNDTYSPDWEKENPNSYYGTDGDFVSEEGNEGTISRNKGVSKNLIIMGSLCAVGAVILFGARAVFSGGKAKQPQADDTTGVQIANNDPMGIQDANNDTGDLMAEAEKQAEDGTSSTDSSSSDSSGDGVSEEEFRKSLEASDNAGSQWDSVGSSPETFSGSSGASSGGADLSEAGSQQPSAEDIKAAQEAEKQKQRSEKLAQARSGGLSFMANQQSGTEGSGSSNTGSSASAPTTAVSNGRVDPNQVPAGTYSVAPDGTVTQVAGGAGGSAGAGGGGQAQANAQPQNTDPFRQTNPAITGRGAAGYGSVNTNSGSLTTQSTKYVLSAGQIIPAVLLSGIRTVTSDMAIAVVSSDVYDTRSGKHLLIPRGSKILGEYSPYIDGANFRVITIWNRIIFPNGDSLNLAQFKGVDLQGYGGMKAQVNTHFWKKLGNVVASTLTAVAYNFADRLTIENGKLKLNKYVQRNADGTTESDSPTTLGQVIQQIQSEASNKNSQIQTVLTIKSGARFNIRVNSDIILDSAYKPYYK